MLLEIYRKISFYFVNILFVISSISTLLSRTSTASDHCQLETFLPSCMNANEVVLITDATYGRMEVGKCISQEEVSILLGQDPKYLGCSSDVSEILHDKCSLKQTCEIKIPDAALDKTKPCFPGLKMYLRAEFTCINVVDQDHTCQIQASSSIPKYLTMRGILNNTSCGTIARPWILEASRGQKIRITFVKIRNKKNPKESNLRIDCGYEIGSLLEKNHGVLINRTFCSTGTFQRTFATVENGLMENKFVSSGSFLELFVKTNIKDFLLSDKDFDDMILLKIEADGCLDIIPPEDTWLKRNGDDMVIGCYSSKQTWYLRCENKKWSGTIGNCSLVQNNKNFDDFIEEPKILEKNVMNKEQQILLIVVISGVGIVFCSAIICVGAVCLRRFTRKQLPFNVYDKQPMYYQDVQHSLNGRSLMKSKDMQGNHGLIQYDEAKGLSANSETTNKENSYFILERDQAEN